MANNVSLDETLFYQYMINNNSTSTMLNAISGNQTDNSTNSLLSALGGLQGINGFGTGSISDVATLLGLGGGAYGGIGSVNSFSSVLQTYLTAERKDAAEMAEKIEDVMEEVTDASEKESRSYQTLEEIYKYFQDRSSDRAYSLLSGLTGTAEKTSTDRSSSNAAAGAVETADFDFDGFEAETDEMIDSMMSETEMI